MSTLEKKVSKEYEGATIREFLKEDLGLSSRLIRRSAIEKRILVNKRSKNEIYCSHWRFSSNKSPK